MSSSEKTLSLANGQLTTCVLCFKTRKQMTAWRESIESCVKVLELSSLKKGSKNEADESTATILEDNEAEFPFAKAAIDDDEINAADKSSSVVRESFMSSVGRGTEYHSVIEDASSLPETGTAN